MRLVHNGSTLRQTASKRPTCVLPSSTVNNVCRSPDLSFFFFFLFLTTLILRYPSRHPLSNRCLRRDRTLDAFPAPSAPHLLVVLPSIAPIPWAPIGLELFPSPCLYFWTNLSLFKFYFLRCYCLFAPFLPSTFRFVLLRSLRLESRRPGSRLSDQRIITTFFARACSPLLIVWSIGKRY